MQDDRNTGSVRCLECRNLMERQREGYLRCHKCYSFWFYEGQIKSFLTKPGLTSLDDLSFTKTTQGPGETCPSCGEAAFRYGGFLAAKYQRCAHCCGLFFTLDDMNDLRRLLQENDEEDDLLTFESSGDTFTETLRRLRGLLARSGMP